jgi:hypothetical protein
MLRNMFRKTLLVFLPQLIVISVLSYGYLLLATPDFYRSLKRHFAGEAVQIDYSPLNAYHRAIQRLLQDDKYE